jgi:hypothetical protein
MTLDFLLRLGRTEALGVRDACARPHGYFESKTERQRGQEISVTSEVVARLYLIYGNIHFNLGKAQRECVCESVTKVFFLSGLPTTHPNKGGQ